MRTVYLKHWSYVGDRVSLEYSDGSEVFVSKSEFDRAFGAIVNASKDEVVRDFAI